MPNAQKTEPGRAGVPADARAPGDAPPIAARRPPNSPRRHLHGVLLLDKPLGWTSNDALQKAKGLLRADKGGHTGTLDPLATGLLPLCFGAATKFAQASLDADKRYRATLRLGQRTSTGDAEGEVVEERAVRVDLDAISDVCRRFTGVIDQRAPMHSAVKHQGRSLYAYARAGIEIDRPPRRVTVHGIELVEWQDEALVIDVSCSKGTYIRSLAEDIGAALGCGAHLRGLRRTGSGGLDVARAVTIAALEAMPEPARDALLLPADVLLADWPEVRLGADEAGRFLCGLRRRVALADATAVRVYADAPKAFLGIAHITAGELIADRLLSPIEVQDCP
jgi:tRNA pseudouridine55 synthase